MLPTLDALGQSGDVARALAFAQAQAASWGGDAGKIIFDGTFCWRASGLIAGGSTPIKLMSSVPSHGLGTIQCGAGCRKSDGIETYAILLPGLLGAIQPIGGVHRQFMY